MSLYNNSLNLQNNIFNDEDSQLLNSESENENNNTNDNDYNNNNDDDNENEDEDDDTDLPHLITNGQNLIPVTNYINNYVNQLNNNKYYKQFLKEHFQLSDFNINLDKIKSTLMAVYNLYNIKIRNRQINKNWFHPTEIMITNQNESNDLSSYIIQLITDQSISLYNILDNIFENPNDKQKIRNIGAIIQEWINVMEYLDGNYHLNIENINDFNTLILWIFIMSADIKFIPAILNSHLLTENIFSIDFLQRKAGGISLMMLSVWNSDIRNIIVSHIEKSLYTTLLNEEVELNNQIKITLLDMSILLGTFYDMIIENNIDPDTINYAENNNIMHLIFETHNIMINKLRKSSIHFKKLYKYDIPNFNEIPENIKSTFNELKFIKNNKNMIPLNNLLYGHIYDSSNYSYILSLKDFINIYNFDNIDKISINSEYPVELLYIYMNNLDNFDNICKTNKTVCDNYINYFLDYAWSLKKCIVPEIKNTITEMCNILSKYSDIVKLFTNNLETNTIIKLISDNHDISSLIINLYTSTQTNILSSVETYSTLEQYNKIINDFVNFINQNNTFLNSIKNPLLETCLIKNHSYNKEIFDIYFKSQLLNEYSTNYQTYLNKFYDSYSDIDKNYISNKIIQYICYDKLNSSHPNTIMTVKKYLETISVNLKTDTFIILCTSMPEIRKQLIKSNLIKTEVKFGLPEHNIHHTIIPILELLDEQFEYTPEDINTYRLYNNLRLIECLTDIEIKSVFDIFIKLFKIDDEFINLFNVKYIYIDKIINGSINIDNLNHFLATFKYTHSDINSEQINIIVNKNSTSGLLLLEHLACEAILDINNVILLFDKFIFYINDDLALSNILDKYNDDTIYKKFLEKLLNKNDLSYEYLESYLDKYSKLNDFVTKYHITNEKNILFLMKYYSQKNKEILTYLIATYNKTFVESNIISLNDKINIIYSIYEFIEDRIPNIIMNNIKITDEIKSECLTKIVVICQHYSIKISNDLIRKFPELIHISTDKELINEILTNSLNNYEIFCKIIYFENKSQQIQKKLLKMTKENDMSLYIDCLVGFNAKLTKSDKKILLESLTTDNILFKYILENEQIKTQLFDSYADLIKLVDNYGNYIITNLEANIILTLIDYYSLDDFKIVNNIGTPRLFSFLINEDIINKIIDKFGLDSLVTIKSNNGHHIYDKMIINGIFVNIPETYILSENNIINIIKNCDTKYLTKLLDNLSKDKFEQIINTKDIDGNNMLYYLIKLHDKLFKQLCKDNKISKDMFSYNNFNETLLMKLIKDSQMYNLDNIIIWIINNFKLDLYDYFVDNKSGSVLSYALKYNANLVKLFLNPDILKLCMNIYDVNNIMCPFSDNSLNKNIKMNIFYIATIIDHQILDKLLKFDKKISNKLFKEKLITNNFEYNLLTIAMFNNPESVQIILGYNGCDNKYIKDTEDSLEGFEKIIDIQPASWYYLQQSMKSRNYKLKLDLESHWYGYTYKRYFIEENIKKITHYILDKQELGDKTNTCNICDTYKRKVVFTKCRHKVCITCAVHSDKCATCRIHIDENDKILM